MGHWVRASGILLSGWDYPKAAQKIRCIHKKNQVKCRHISKSYLSAHPSIIQLFAHGRKVWCIIYSGYLRGPS